MDLAIVRAIIDLAHAMGISAVAEGVETKDQAAELNMLGCPVGQGFYCSQPLPAEEFGELLIRHFTWSADRPAGADQPERAKAADQSPTRANQAFVR